MGDFEWAERNEWADEEEPTEEDNAQDRDCVLFLIECTPSMFESNPDGEIPFHIAIQCASLAYQEKVILSDRDLVGLCFFGSREKRNQFDFNNIYLFHDLDTPDATRIKELDLILEDNDSFLDNVGFSEKSYALSDVLWTAQHLFSHVPKNVGYKRIFMFTNNHNPVGDDASERKKCIERSKDLMEANILIELFALRKPKKKMASSKGEVVNREPVGSVSASMTFNNSLAGSSLEQKPRVSLSKAAAISMGGVALSGTGSDQKKSITAKTSTNSQGSGSGMGSTLWSPYGSSSASQDTRYDAFDTGLFWKHVIYTGDDDCTGSITFDCAQKFRDMALGVRKRALRKRTAGRFNIIIGPDANGTSPLSLAVELYFPMMKAPKARSIWVDNETNRPIKAETRHLCPVTGAELMTNEIVNYYQCGGEKVVFSKAELQQIRTHNYPQGLRLLGFKPLSRLKLYHNITHCGFLYPSDSAVKGSTKLFATLLQQMWDKGVMGVGMLVPRANAAPRMVALLPQEEVVDSSGQQIEPPGLALIYLPYADDIRDVDLGDTSQKCTTEQLREAKKMIQHLSIEFSSEEFENPALQHHFSCLHAIALEHSKVEEKEDVTEPDLEGMKLHSPAIQAFRQAVFGSAYTSAVPKKGAVKAEGDDGPAAKKPKKDIDITRLNFEDLSKANKLDTCNLEELKQYCRSKGLRVSGKKAEIIERITSSFPGK